MPARHFTTLSKKWILVVEVKWRHHANGLLSRVGAYSVYGGSQFILDSFKNGLSSGIASYSDVSLSM